MEQISVGMGWDLRFIRTGRVGYILDNGEGFKIKFIGNDITGNPVARLYVEDGDGWSGIYIHASEDDYRDLYLNYAWAGYSVNVRGVLWELWRQFGFMFGELDDCMYYSQVCENHDELEALTEHNAAEDMLGMFGEGNDPDGKLRGIVERTSPLFEELVRRSKVS